MSLLLKVKPLVVSPLLACRIGLNEAIVLQQICYWLEETNSGIEYEGKRWVYNSINAWNEQFPWWTGKTIQRTVSSLKKMGLIYVEQLKKKQHDQTNYYAINYESPLLTDKDNLSLSSKTICPNRKGQFARIDKDNMPQSIGTICPTVTENTTEITTEITGKDPCPVSAKPDDEQDEFKVLDHLNRAAGLRYQKSRSSLGPIRGRLAEDFTAEELILAVDYTIAKWADDAKMRDYVRPETIFRQGKFPAYLGSAQAWERAGRPPCIKGKWQRDTTQVASMDYQIPDGFRG